MEALDAEALRWHAKGENFDRDKRLEEVDPPPEGGREDDRVDVLNRDEDLGRWMGG